MPAMKVIMRCSECSNQNYYTEKNRQNTPDRLVLRKYCAACRKHTSHEEARVRK